MSTCGTCGVEMNENEKYCKACGDGSPRDAVLNQKKARVMTSEKTWVKPAAIAAAVIVAVGALWLAKDVFTFQKTDKPRALPRIATLQRERQTRRP